MLATARAEPGVQQSWLEHLPTAGGAIQRTPLDGEAVTIGRGEAVDLQIDSTRVSREHARIERQGDAFLLRDLGSTNGTFVNGEPVDRVLLSDGDVIMVADTEVTFLTNATSRLRRMATQPLLQVAEDSSFDDCADGSGLSDTQSAQRRMRTLAMSQRLAHLMLAERAVPSETARVVDIHSGELFAQAAFAHEAQAELQWGAVAQLGTASRARRQCNQMRRQIAVESCPETIDCRRLAVEVESWETDDVQPLCWHFETLRRDLPREVALLALLDANEAVDLPNVGQFCRDLPGTGAKLALGNFVGSGSHIRELGDLRPEMLLLAPEMTASVQKSTRRQRQLVQIVRVCQDFGIHPAASGLHERECQDALVTAGVSLLVESPDVGPRISDSHSPSVLAAI